MEVDDRQAAQIHGIISSDSDSDFDNQREFDEEYNLLKPPPLNYEKIKDKIVVISQKQDLNIWEERLKNVQIKSEEEKIQTVNDIKPTAKKKKKKSKSKAVNKVENIGIPTAKDEKGQIQLKNIKDKKKIQNKPENNAQLNNGAVRIDPVPKIPKNTKQKDNQKVINKSNDSVVTGGSKTKKKKAAKCKSETIFYNPKTLLKMEEKLDKLENIWHSGLNTKTINKELSLQRQKESSMYDSWLKTADKESDKKKDKTSKDKEKTQKGSNRPIGASPNKNSLENIGIIGSSKKKTLKSKNEDRLQVNVEEVMREVKITENRTENRNSRLLGNETIEYMWGTTNFTDNMIQLPYNYLIDIGSNSTFNYELKNVSTMSEPSKKCKAKKKKKWKLLFKKLSNQNLPAGPSNVKNSVEDIEKQNESSSQIKKDPKETLECLEISRGQEKQNQKLLNEEIMKQAWILPDDIDEKIRSDTQAKLRNTESNFEDIKYVDSSAATGTTKTKKKKKSKLLINVLSNQNLPAGPSNIKNSVEGIEKQNESPSQIKKDSKETLECLEISRDQEKQNQKLLNKEIMKQAWILPDDIDGKIRSNTQAKLRNTESNFEDIKYVDSSAATGTTKTKKKKKSKLLINELSNQNLPVGPSNIKNSVEDIEKQNESPSQIKKDSKETLECLEISRDQEKQNQKLLNKEITKQMWILPEDSNFEDIKYIDMSTATGTTKTKKKKKKKPKQPTTDELIIDLSHEVGQDSTLNVSKTSEDQHKENQTEILGEQTNEKTEEYVFDDDFKNFMQNIDCTSTDIVRSLNDFKYEQSQRAYTAFQKKKDTNKRQDAPSGTVSIKNSTNKLQNVVPSNVFLKNGTQESNVVWYSFGNPNTNLGICFVPTLQTNYLNGHSATHRGETSYIKSKVKINEIPKTPEITDSIKENSNPRVLDSVSNATNAKTLSPINFPTETEKCTKFHLQNEPKPEESLDKSHQITALGGETKNKVVGPRENLTDALKNYQVNKENFHAKTVVQNTWNSNVANNRNDNYLNTNLAPNKPYNIRAAKDFEESHERFRDFKGMVNNRQSSPMYQLMYESIEKSRIGNDNKKAVNTSIPTNTVRGGLSYYLDRSNINLRSTPPVSTAYNGSSSHLVRDTGYRKNLISSQSILRRAPRSSWENGNDCSYSDYLRRNDNFFNNPVRNEIVTHKYPRQSSNDNYYYNHSTVEFEEIDKTGYFNNHIYMNTTNQMSNYADNGNTILEFLMWVFIIIVGIFVISAISSFVLFLQENIFYVFGVLLVCIILWIQGM